MRCAPIVLLLALVLSLGACGDPRPPGGQGRLDQREGLPDRLVLAGTPYEMGWWHGRLLRERILKLRKSGLQHLESRALGRSARQVDALLQLEKAIQQHLALVVDQTLHRLSERVLQELEGMAAATGLESAELIRLDVARDALRMKGLEGGLPGAAGLGLVEGGFEARVLWGGADAAWLAEHGVVIHRKPVGGRENVSLSWPGSLGAVACAAAEGRGFLLAEVDVRDKRRLGFGGGRPFMVAAREALDTSPDADDLLAATTATMGHLFLGFIAQNAQPPVHAMAGVGAFTGSPDPIVALGEDPFMALGPYEDAKSPAVRSVWEAVVRPADLPIEERWLRLREHAAREKSGGDGPEVRVRWRPGETTFSFRRSADAPPREVTLRD